MANELSLSIDFTWLNGDLTTGKSYGKSLDVTGTVYDQGTQTIGTSEEVLAVKSDLGTPGYVYFRNHDSGNYLEIGPATGVYLIKLAAGQACILPLDVAKNSIYCKANTGAVELEFVVLEV
jgi:hypothetical protein